MDKSTRGAKLKSRLQAAEGVLKKCEEKLEQVDKIKRERFSDHEMQLHAKEAAEGLDLSCIDELRSMKLAPPPVVEMVARCVSTLASGDDLGDAEYRAALAAAEAALQKKTKKAVAKGEPPPHRGTQLDKKRLLTWEESQTVLARADFKERIANFDGRMLLDNEDLVNAVISRIDLGSINPTLPMSVLTAAPKRSRKERTDEVIAAVRRREAYTETPTQQGSSASTPLLTLDDARYVSKIAPPLLVWTARVLAQHTVNDPIWKKTTATCEEASVKRDEAKQAVMQLRKKMDEFAQAQREEKARAKIEKDRTDEIGHQTVEQERPKEKMVEKPKELTTPGQVGLSGLTPNLFFQNGRISGIHPRPVELSPRLQMPTKIFFFIRVKHARVSWPFPPSLSPEKYLHKAEVIPGYEEAGPVAHVPFDGAHVIGLYNHELLSFVQLVLEVPSTASINPTIHPARLSFDPRHGAQLHCGAGGAGTIEMPRIIVTVYPHLISRGASRAASAPPRTFEASDMLRHERAGASPFRASGGLKSPLHGMQRLRIPVSDASKDGANLVAGSARSGTSARSASTRSGGIRASARSDSVRSASGPSSNVTHASTMEAPSAVQLGVESAEPPVPPLHVDLMHSIGSAYRSKSWTKQGKPRATASPCASSIDGDDQGWSRVAIALTERARTSPFLLSKPGPARPIPDILLQNTAVSIASARRLTRLPSKKGLDYLKGIAAVVGRVMDGYILTPAEKRQLREASVMELEAARLEAEEAAAAESAAAEEAAEGAASQEQQPMLPAGLVYDSTTDDISAEARAALNAVAKEEATPSAGAAAFSNIFGPSVAAAAALAVEAAAAGAPGEASIAQDAFATAVQTAAVANPLRAPPPLGADKRVAEGRHDGSMPSARRSKSTTSQPASSKGESKREKEAKLGGQRADGAASSKPRSASPRSSREVASLDVSATRGTPRAYGSSASLASARGKPSARGPSGGAAAALVPPSKTNPSSRPLAKDTAKG